jgi:crotonobetainyl-CoA:carnitine CoA-transferase CaiB-like acyl-CoA transferase
VVKVEPPGGAPSRRLSPLLEDAPPEEASLYWAAYNANKRGITLDLDRPAGRDLLLRLADRADLLIESLPPGDPAAMGLDHADLAPRNPGLIHVSITPFGRTGPYAAHRASDLVVWAMAGCQSMAGEPGGTPWRVSLAQAPMWTGMHAAMGALLALAARARTGRGQHVDVSAQAACIAALSVAPAFWDVLRENPSRNGVFLGARSVTGARMRAFWPCRDGYVTFAIYGGAAGRQSNRGLLSWMLDRGAAPGRLAEIEWDTFDVRICTQEEIDHLEVPIGAFFATVTKAEFVQEALARGILGYPVATAADIAAHPQLQAREFWRELPGPAAGSHLRHPGAFARFPGWDAGPRRPAPRVGEHNAEVLGGELGLSPAELDALRAQGVI